MEIASSDLPSLTSERAFCISLFIISATIAAYSDATVAGDEKLKSAYLMFVDFICNETLTSEINWADSLPNAVKVDADDKEWGIVIEKA